MSQYSAGTATVTNGSPIVTFTGTAMLTNATVGGMFSRTNDLVNYDVGSVDSDTQVTLTAPYVGVTGSGVGYSITNDFTVNNNLPIIQVGDINTDLINRRQMNTLDPLLNQGVKDTDSPTFNTVTTTNIDGTLGANTPAPASVTTLNASGISDFSTAGAYFGTAAAANLLDDFEEGTFTPTWTSSTGSGTVTYVTNTGIYVKIGDWVFWEIHMRTSSIALRTGVVYIDGMPFTAASGTEYPALIGFAANLNITAGESLSGYIGGATTRIVLRIWNSVAGQAGLTYAEWSDDGYVTLTGSYKV